MIVSGILLIFRTMFTRKRQSVTPQMTLFFWVATVTRTQSLPSDTLVPISPKTIIHPTNQASPSLLSSLLSPPQLKVRLKNRARRLKFHHCFGEVLSWRVYTLAARSQCLAGLVLPIMQTHIKRKQEGESSLAWDSIKAPVPLGARC